MNGINSLLSWEGLLPPSAPHPVPRGALESRALPQMNRTPVP